MPCERCGRVQTDPVKGAAPWAGGVAGGRQVLICPDCQRAEPSWSDTLDRCWGSGSTRLSLVLGSIVCRACGCDRPAPHR